MKRSLLLQYLGIFMFMGYSATVGAQEFRVVNPMQANIQIKINEGPIQIMRPKGEIRLGEVPQSVEINQPGRPVSAYRFGNPPVHVRIGPHRDRIILTATRGQVFPIAPGVTPPPAPVVTPPPPTPIPVPRPVVTPPTTAELRRRAAEEETIRQAEAERQRLEAVRRETEEARRAEARRTAEARQRAEQVRRRAEPRPRPTVRPAPRPVVRPRPAVRRPAPRPIPSAPVEDIWQIAQEHGTRSPFEASRTVAGPGRALQQVANTGEVQPFEIRIDEGNVRGEIRQMPCLNQARQQRQVANVTGCCGYYAVYNADCLANNRVAQIQNRDTFINEFYNMLALIRGRRAQAPQGPQAPYDNLDDQEIRALMQQQGLLNNVLLITQLMMQAEDPLPFMTAEQQQILMAFVRGETHRLITIAGYGVAAGHWVTIEVTRPDQARPNFLRFSIYDSASANWYDQGIIQQRIGPLYESYLELRAQSTGEFLRQLLMPEQIAAPQQVQFPVATTPPSPPTPEPTPIRPATEQTQVQCPICQEEFARAETIELPCGHRLCRACLQRHQDQLRRALTMDPWERSGDSYLLRLYREGYQRCPLCREQIPRTAQYLYRE